MQTEDTHEKNVSPGSPVYHNHTSGRSTAVPLFSHADVVMQSPFERPPYPEILAGSEITKTLQELVMEIEDLRLGLEKKAYQYDAQEYLAKSLHKELQTYREGLHLKLLRPIFLDLISMYHDLGRLVKDMVTRDMSVIMQRTAKNMESFQETVEEILRRYGVETFCVEDNTFLANQQCIVHIIHTADRSLDRHIAHRVHKGFRYEDKILSPEMVTVYRVENEE